MKTINKSVYIILAVLCFISLFSIAGLLQTRNIKEKPTQITFDNQTINIKIQQAIAGDKIINIFFLIFLTMTYLLIFTAGIVNILLLAVKRCRREPLLGTNAKPDAFGLNPKQTAQIFLVLAFSFLIIYTVNIYLYFMQGPEGQNARSLILNLTMQSVTIALIIKHITIDKSKFNIKSISPINILHAYSMILPAIFIAAAVLKIIGITPSTNAAVEIMLSLKNNLLIFILIFQIVIMAPIAEELLFRRIIYNGLRQKYSFFAAAAATSFVFSLLHHNPGLIGPLFMVSMGLCYIYEKTQNITSAMALHALFKTMNMVLLLTVKSLY